mgnify:CR=1 FL=1
MAGVDGPLFLPDRVAIIEDVVTAGTAVRESIELFKGVAKVDMKALFVSVDRFSPAWPLNSSKLLGTT